MIKGSSRAFERRWKDRKARAVELKENELILEFSGRKQGPERLTLQGLIGFRDAGMIGSALAGMRLEDKGSFKEIAFLGPKGAVLFKARFMEGVLTAGPSGKDVNEGNG